MTSVPTELSENVSKLVELTKQNSEEKADIKILTQEEKRLKGVVKGLMTDQGIDTINLRKGKINVKTSVRKTGFNKNSVHDGLMAYFGGDEVKVEGAMTAIKDTFKVTETSVISLTGIKNKTDTENN